MFSCPAFLFYVMNDVQSHVRLLFESYLRVTGRVLWNDSWSGLDDAQLEKAVTAAPCVIASHGTEDDPILNYGNLAAINLWETNWEEFTQMPSRLTAEPLERSERERLLDEVTTNGFIDNYSGIRVTTTGKRFIIRAATVWNVLDSEHSYLGQAVIFSNWNPI